MSSWYARFGGTAEKAMMLAKEALMETWTNYFAVDQRTKSKNFVLWESKRSWYWCSRSWRFILDIKIKDYPCHAAGKPVFRTVLRLVMLTSSLMVQVYSSTKTWRLPFSNLGLFKRVNLDTITQEEMDSWKPHYFLAVQCTQVVMLRTNVNDRQRWRITSWS